MLYYRLTAHLEDAKIPGQNTERGLKQDLLKLKEMSMQEDTQSFSMPKSSLQDRSKIASRREAELNSHTKELESCIMPLSRKEFLKLTHALEEKSAKKHFYQVMNRYPHLCF
jgi:hypothetical protein